MKNEIEWFEEDGVQGGQRGLKVDLINKKITKWNGVVEDISKNNLGEVRWCIDMNIKSLIEKIDHTTYKLNQTKTERIKIEGGYRISEPLTETQKIKYKGKLDLLVEELDELFLIDIK